MGEEKEKEGDNFQKCKRFEEKLGRERVWHNLDENNFLLLKSLNNYNLWSLDDIYQVYLEISIQISRVELGGNLGWYHPEFIFTFS